MCTNPKRNMKGQGDKGRGIGKTFTTLSFFHSSLYSFYQHLLRLLCTGHCALRGAQKTRRLNLLSCKMEMTPLSDSHCEIYRRSCI